MNAKDQLAEKISGHERQKQAENAWSKTFSILLLMWTVVSVPPLLLLSADHPEAPLGALVTIYAGGIGVLVPISAWRIRAKSGS